MSIEGTPDGPGATPVRTPETEQAVDPIRQRIRDMVDLDVWLGPPYGQRHGDDWSIGGVQPRWPRVREPLPEPDGPIIGEYSIDFETGEISYTSFLQQTTDPTTDGVTINDDGTFTAPEAPDEIEPNATEQ